jgi:hypothetical protein
MLAAIVGAAVIFIVVTGFIFHLTAWQVPDIAQVPPQDVIHAGAARKPSG